MLVIVLLALGLTGAAQASTPAEYVRDIKYSAGVATDGTLARDAARAIKDCERFPDKSKLPQKCMTEAELAKYDGRDGRPVYIAIANDIYDVTDYADLHPGGAETLKRNGGHSLAQAACSALPKQVRDAVFKKFQVGSLNCNADDCDVI